MEKKWFEDQPFVADLMSLAATTVDAVAERFGHRDNGGWIAIGDNNGRTIGKLLVGTMTPEGTEKSSRLVEEKISRLAAHPQHVTSYQSRNHDEEQYGGAIRVDGGFLSFSGFTEKLDEAFVLGVARLEHLVKEGSTVHNIVLPSENESLAEEVCNLMAVVIEPASD